MPILSVTRSYEARKTPVQSDIDNIVDDIEILVNTTKLDDTNFQTSGITASTKFVDGSISTSTIRNSNITTAKIADGSITNAKINDRAVTTAKIVDSAVTNAKLSTLSGKFPVGAVTKFHTYNGTVSVPRGWMILNGDVINETNYNSLHGAGTYTTDGIASSPIISKTLPSMNNRYAIGASATTQDGSSTIAAVGNTSHQISVAHTHTTSHTHNLGVADFALIATTVVALGSYGTQTSGGQVDTESTSVASGSAGSSTQSIQPESVQFIFCMRVI